MALTEDQKRSIRSTLSQVYGEAMKPTGTNVSGCWTRPGKGQRVTGVDVNCLVKAGETLGGQMKNIWGKS